jgi:SAM-dependent methyltransferase
VRSINLSKRIKNSEISNVKELYEREDGSNKQAGIYRWWDWARVDFVYSELFYETPGFFQKLLGSKTKHRQGLESVLDVGVGAGQLLNALRKNEMIAEVHGIDIKLHSKFKKLDDRIHVHLGSVDQLPFEDNQFQNVICMEVLEHVEKEVFLKGVDELRRVCRDRLFMTVPFKEPEPLPKFHKLRFEKEDLDQYFPNAKITILEREGSNVPWALMEETLS